MTFRNLKFDNKIKGFREKSCFEVRFIFTLCINLIKYVFIIVDHTQVPYFLRYNIFCFSTLKIFSNKLPLV